MERKRARSSIIIELFTVGAMRLYDLVTRLM
jgi:hypothetical protein